MTDTTLTYAGLGDILGEHRAYIGASGSGKSTTARGHVERLLRERRHTCITDHLGVWWGLRSDAAGTGAGYDIPIFGGRKGDVQFHAGDGAAIGRIVGDGVSAVVDLSALRTGGEQREFMHGFIGALRAKPPGHFQLVCDEADEDVPERIRDEAGFALQEDMIWIAKRGRSDGFVLSLITQRPASIAKEALSQAQTIFAHQLIAPTDKKALGEYVKSQGTTAEYKEIMARLPTLQVGERYLYSPKRHLMDVGRSPLPETFDSSRTPGPGETRAEPKLLSEIDVGAIAAQLDKQKIGRAVEAYAAGAEAGQLLIEKDARIADLEAANALLTLTAEELAAERDQLCAGVSAALELLGGVGAGRAPNLQQHDANSQSAEPGASPSSPRPQAEGAPVAAEASDPAGVSTPKDGAVRGGAALPALLIYPRGLTEQQWAWVSGFTRKGGTWSTYKSSLRSAGLVEERGGRWFAIGAADAAAGTFGQVVRIGPDLARMWGRKLSGVSRMVEVLIKRWPHLTTRGGLAADLNMAASGGTFSTYLSRLRGAGMLEEQGKSLRLHPELMEYRP